jgi:hypothetical protein
MMRPDAAPRKRQLPGGTVVTEAFESPASPQGFPALRPRNSHTYRIVGGVDLAVGCLAGRKVLALCDENPASGVGVEHRFQGLQPDGDYLRG